MSEYLYVSIVRNISATMSGPAMCGSVIVEKRRKMPAPSTWAAS
jgi:hypothetical protein